MRKNESKFLMKKFHMRQNVNFKFLRFHALANAPIVKEQCAALAAYRDMASGGGDEVEADSRSTQVKTFGYLFRNG